MAAQPPGATTAPALWMVVASLLFACMGVCVKLGAGVFSTGELVFYRGFIGFLLMAILMLGRGTPWRTPHWRAQITRGISGTAALMCYFYALGHLPLATAVTLNYTSPIFVALLLAFWFGERIRRPLLLAVLIGFGGVVLLLRPTLQPDQWAGAAAGLGSGAVASIAYVSVRELGRLGEPEPRTVLWFSALTSLIGLPWALAGEPLHQVDLRGAAILLGVGIFGGCAQLAMTRSYRYGKTLVSANLAYSTVIFSSLFGVLFWSERLPASAWLAVGLIIASGVLISVAANRTATPSRAEPLLPAAAEAPASSD
ncbi:MAG: DMT family transporter [Zoogloeaceae bacterium]|nr:DMT family transporter [Zoogloeaceae bacterium]